MSIPVWFMEVARGMLPPATFEEVYARAVEKERKQIEQQPTAKAPAVSGAVLQNVSAHLTGEKPAMEVKPHAAERMEKRLDIQGANQGDMHELIKFIKAGGPNVQVIRQRMEMNQELVVNWRGKHFNVLWSKSREKLITITAKTRKKKGKVWAGRPRERRDDVLADIDL